MKFVWLLSLVTLSASDALHARMLNDPIRVRLPEFVIKFSPAKQNLTVIEAAQVRDIAETMFEEYLTDYNWGAATIYSYSGLLGVESVEIDSSVTPSESVIRIWGGLVVFDASSSIIPSDLESMLEESLYPSSSSKTTLTNLLKSTSEFSFVESTTYELYLGTTPTSTLAPITSSLAPSFSPFASPNTPSTMSPVTESTSPTKAMIETPSFYLSPSPSEPTKISFSPISDTNVSLESGFPSFRTEASAEGVLTGDDTNSMTSIFGAIGGVLASFCVTGALIALFFMSKDGHRKRLWKTDSPHIIPVDETDDYGLHKMDSLQSGEHGACDAKSDTGSSLLGRLRAAASTPARVVLTECTTITPHCSSDSEESDAFDIPSTTILPSIMKLNSLESFGTDRDASYTVDLPKETTDPSFPVVWSTAQYDPAVHGIVDLQKQETESSFPASWSTTLSEPATSTIASQTVKTNSLFPTSWITAISGVTSTLCFDKWSDDGRSSDGTMKGPDGSLVDSHFTPDDLWDFQDNEEDPGDGTLDPFSTPTINESRRTLLGKTIERSSPESPSANC